MDLQRQKGDVDDEEASAREQRVTTLAWRKELSVEVAEQQTLEAQQQVSDLQAALCFQQQGFKKLTQERDDLSQKVTDLEASVEISYEDAAKAGQEKKNKDFSPPVHCHPLFGSGPIAVVVAIKPGRCVLRCNGQLVAVRGVCAATTFGQLRELLNSELGTHPAMLQLRLAVLIPIGGEESEVVVSSAYDDENVAATMGHTTAPVPALHGQSMQAPPVTIQARKLVVVSYQSNQNASGILSQIKSWIKEWGYEPWSGDQIPGHADWRQDWCARVAKCVAVVFIISESFVNSEACKQEMYYVTNQKSVPIMVESFAHPDWLRLKLGTCNYIHMYDQPIVDQPADPRLQLALEHCVPPTESEEGQDQTVLNGTTQPTSGLPNLKQWPSGWLIGQAVRSGATAEIFTLRVPESPIGLPLVCKRLHAVSWLFEYACVHPWLCSDSIWLLNGVRSRRCTGRLK